jgi:hypothetical protein
MIREKSKNRVTRIEANLPKSGAKDDVKIECTEEAWSMLEPYADWFNTMEGKTLVYTPTPDPNVISTNTPVSVTIGYALWMREIGSAIAVISTQDYYAIPEHERPVDMRGMEGNEIDKRMAERVIRRFKEFGIVIE